MWKYIGDGSHTPGAVLYDEDGKPRDLTDDEYAELNAGFKEREGVDIKKTGLYEHVADKKSAKEGD